MDRRSDIVRFSLSESLMREDDEVGQLRMFEHERNNKSSKFPSDNLIIVQSNHAEF